MGFILAFSDKTQPSPHKKFFFLITQNSSHVYRPIEVTSCDRGDHEESHNNGLIPFKEYRSKLVSFSAGFF